MALTSDLVYRPPTSSGLTAATIDRFIGTGNPLAQAGGAATLLRATGGNLQGAAFLAALARKESEFGRTAGRFRNNFWGWGVHLGSDVNTSPSVEEGARKVWTGLQSGLYKGAGLTTPSAIIQKYAPPSENDTGLYQRQVNQWFTQLGLSPGTNIFGGPSVPMPAGASPGLTRAGVGTPSMTPDGQAARQTGFQLTPQMAAKLQAYLVGSREDVLAGRAPRDVIPVFNALGAAGAAAPVYDMTGRTRRAAAAPAGGVGDPFNITPGSTYGFAAGAVDSGKAVAGGEGGDWGGSMERALALAKAVGATPSSQKRSRRLTASGNPSDHWTGSTASYATDLPTSGAAGDALFAKIKAAIGQNIRPGTWNNVNIGGYRYQIGWRVPGHYDHIHVGVKRL